MSCKKQQQLTDAKFGFTLPVAVSNDIPIVASLRHQNKLMNSKNGIYIGRQFVSNGQSLKQSKWANPFKISECDGSAHTAVSKYEEYIRNKPELMASIVDELSGKVLYCWCKPNVCHGDVLVKLYKELKSTRQ